MNSRLKKRIKFIFIAIILFLPLGYSLLVEPNSLVVENESIVLECAKDKFSDNKIVQISDLHFTSETSDERIEQIYNEIRKIDASVVFVTGDLISDENGIEKALDLTGKMAKKYPVYIVLGNWDYWSLDFAVSDFRKKLEDAGAKVLINEADRISMGSGFIDILGVKDPYTSGDIKGDLEKTIGEINKSGDSCMILLAHSPNVIKEATESNIDLVLVGHTHGGQVYIPYLTEKFIPARRKSGIGFVKGLYEIDQTKMYVNRGIGTSTLPFRFLLPPEITIITLKNKG